MNQAEFTGHSEKTDNKGGQPDYNRNKNGADPHRPNKFTKTVHKQEPDYTRPTLKLEPEARERILKRMKFLYGDDIAEAYLPELERYLKIYFAHKPQEMIDRYTAFDPENRFTEEDVILITYGDIFHGEERSPLATLANFCDSFLKGAINTLHILPFFPYSSDKGFSIIDFGTVDPRLGSWQDIDLSSYIPSGCPAVIIKIRNTYNATDYTYGLQRKGDTDNKTGTLMRSMVSHMIIKPDSNRYIQVYSNHNNLRFHLFG